MSQYSELMGSFVRTGNYPLEANYIFNTVEELNSFYEQPINKTILHEGLLKFVLEDNSLYWAVPKDEELVFEKLIDCNTFNSVEDLKLKLDYEIKERLLADIAIYGIFDIAEIDSELNNIFKLSKAILNLKEELALEVEDRIDSDKDLQDNIDVIKEELKATVGTEEDNIIEYLQTLDYKNLTELSDTLNKFLNTFDEEEELINTLPELLDFLRGFTHTHNLYECFVDFWTEILGTPTPNTQFRTLRGIQDFVEALASVCKHREDNLLTELDLTQVGVGLSGDGSYNADKETYYLKDATSVMNALKTLDSLINQAINNCNLQVEDTDTVDLTIVKESDKTTISAKVKVSSEISNDIITKNDGIYHNIDSEYKDGILTIKVNGNIRLQHVLGLSSIVDDGFYDPSSESIKIIFKLHDGNKQTVNIPVSSLISEWTVDNSINTKVVELTKERVAADGADKLSADVRLSSNKYNILEKDNNTLLVKGTADNIIYDGDVTVKSKLDKIITHETDIDTSVQELKDNLRDEKVRAEAAEHALQDGINSEVIRATDKEALLDHRIDDLKDYLDLNFTNDTALKELVSSLEKNLTDEVNRAKIAEQSLANDITLLRTDVETKDGDLLNKIELEKVRAETAEDILNTKIETVLNNIENNINTKISTLLDSLNQEISRSTQEDSNIKSEIADIKLNNVAILNNISLETLRATNAETLLLHLIDDVSDKVEAEKDRAIALETILANSISDVNLEIIATNLKLDSEIVRSIERDNLLDKTIMSEITRSTDTDLLLDHRIDNVADDLALEVSRASLVESNLKNAIDLEVARATKKEDELEALINSSSTSNSLSVEDTSSIDMKVVKSDSGTTISSNVIVSSVSGNIILSLDSGLYATVDVDYDTATNKISFFNGLTTKTLLLSTGSVIDNIVYDKATESLILHYKDAQGNSNSVTVNLADLITEWDITNNPNSVITLTKSEHKVSGVDILSAELKISNKSEQLLLNIDGYLYASNNSTDIIYKDSTVHVELEKLIQAVNQAKDDLISLDLDLKDEIKRSTDKDNELSNAVTKLTTDLSNEVVRATAVESNLDTKIEAILTVVTSSVNTRIDALLDNLNNEINRATLKEESLNDKIDSLKTTSLDLSSAILLETLRAKAEEEAINTLLDNHVKNYNNPHMVTSDLVGTYTKELITDLIDKVSNTSNDKYDSLRDSIEDYLDDLSTHINDTNNPHNVTAFLIGLGRVDNTTDLEKPISVATLNALNTINIELSKKADNSDIIDHITNFNNPHNVSKELIGLNNVDNTSDMNKPISLATLMALDKKSDIGHKHVMSDIEDLENLPIIKGFVELLAELPENAAGGDKYILTTKVGSGNTRYTLCEFNGADGTWSLKLLTTGGIACHINGDVWKLNSSGIERVLDVSDYTYFYNKIYDETKDLIEDIDWEENDETNDTNLQIRLKITYKTKYGDPNESEVTNPYLNKAVKYIDIEKARFLANAYSRPAIQDDVNNGYATTVGEPLLILVLTTGDHVTISLKDSLNIYDPVDTPSIDMSVSDWTGNPNTSYKVSADIRIASTEDAKDAVTLHILDGSEKGLYSTLHTANTNSITLNPATGTSKELTANLNINNTLNEASDVKLTIDASGLSAKLIWGEYD